MSKQYALQASAWKYDGIYSFYDLGEEDAQEFRYSCAYFSCVNQEGEFIGYFCFGAEAQIPTSEENVYDGDFLDIGMGLKPDLCGGGV